ncbi:MAG: DUF4280 domain-containing protein [Acetobacteraceae bacterium]|nr:DUF4280 domain-containing protein [Acetobacteraceae bacterium]
MPIQVVNTALLKCTFGMAPSSLTVLPVKRVNVANQPSATIMDHKPMVNIKPFGNCMCPANPTVASATAAAMGVLTPMPCVPNTPAPWAPGGITVNNTNEVTLDDPSILNCVYGGVITVAFPGQTQTFVP